MATKFEIVLGLKDAETVKRGLQSLGAEGERALKKLEQASQPASKGLQILDQASAGLQNQMSGLSSRAGIAGSALETLGKGGLAAAAGIGAVILVLGKVIQHSQDAAKHFGDMSDAADRVGTSAGRMQALQTITLNNAGSVDKLETSLENLAISAQKAVDGDEKLAAAFERNGVPLDFLIRQGGDAAVVFDKLSEHGLTAADRMELMGKTAKGLGPTIEALHGNLNALVDNSVDPTAKAFNELQDRSEALNRQFTELGKEGSLELQQDLLAVKEALFDLEKWFLSTAEAGQKFWQSVLNKSAWASLGSLKQAAREGLGLDVGQSAEDAQLAKARAEPGPSPLTITVSKGVSSARRGGGGRSAAEPKLDLAFGKPFDAEIERMNALSQNSLTKTQQNAIDTMKRIVDANLEAHDEVIKLIEERRDEELKALDIVALAEEDKAKARVLINDTANQRMAEADARTPEAMAAASTDVPMTDWQKAGAALTEFGDKLTSVEGISQGVISGISSIGATATSAFADAVVAGEGFSAMMTSLGTTIEKMLIQMALQLAMQQAIGGGAGWLGGILGSGTAAGGGGFALGGAGSTTSFGATLARGGFVNRLPQGVYSFPTLFPMDRAGITPMARGMGLMGEAGPEAVMPLKRMSGGNLGVASAAPVVNVTVNNSSSARVSTEQRQGQGGEMELIFNIVEQKMAERMVRPGTNLNRAWNANINPVRAR